MRDYEPPKGPLAALASALILVGLVINVVVNVILGDTPWIGTPLLVAGVLLSIFLLLRQGRRIKQR